MVILEDPKSKNCYLVKRLVALPGDQIIPLGFNKERGEAVKLKEGEVWVESEAFGYKDSNMFGPVKEDSIQVSISVMLILFKFHFRDAFTIIKKNQFNLEFSKPGFATRLFPLPLYKLPKIW